MRTPFQVSLHVSLLYCPASLETSSNRNSSLMPWRRRSAIGDIRETLRRDDGRRGDGWDTAATA